MHTACSTWLSYLVCSTWLSHLPVSGAVCSDCALHIFDTEQLRILLMANNGKYLTNRHRIRNYVKPHKQDSVENISVCVNVTSELCRKTFNTLERLVRQESLHRKYLFS